LDPGSLDRKASQSSLHSMISAHTPLRLRSREQLAHRRLLCYSSFTRTCSRLRLSGGEACPTDPRITTLRITAPEITTPGIPCLTQFCETCSFLASPILATLGFSPAYLKVQYNASHCSIMTQQVFNAIPAMLGFPMPHGRDALQSSSQLVALQQILEERTIGFPPDLTTSILAMFQASKQIERILSRLSSDPVTSPEVDFTPPSTSFDIPDDTLLSTETITRNVASRSCTESVAAVACSPSPGPSTYHYRPTGQRDPNQVDTHRRLEVSSAPTAAVKIEPRPPHSPFDLGAGDGSSSHGDDSSTHVGESSTSNQERGFEFDDDESSRSDEGDFSHQDAYEDGDYVDDAANVTGDCMSERSTARSDSPILPTRAIDDSLARSTRAVEEVRVSAARPQNCQLAHLASSPAPLSSRLSKELARVTRNNRALNGGNRSVRSNSGTQHVYKVLKPSINPLRSKPLLVNGGIPTHK
jgi:hypothetical protein